VDSGLSLSKVAELLEEKGVIKSKQAFKAAVYMLGGRSGAKFGDYFFEEAKNVLVIAERIIKADFGISPIRITVPEGNTAYEISLIIGSKIDDFKKEEFAEKAKEYEGYLFPDTYFFLPNIEPNQVIKEMKNNFDSKITDVLKQTIEKKGRTIEEIVIMASLLEKEARTTQTRRIISGILWERMEIGMLLQVDAVFPYMIGKNTFEVTRDDLKTDSPYNTYKYNGLPKGPIANPGMDAILAAVYPEKTDYLFYLSDIDGNMHYAVDFEEHKANKFRYLR